MLAVSVEAGGLGKAVAHARGQRAVSQRSARLGAGPVMASGLYTEVCEGPGKAYGDSSPVGSEPSVFFLTLWDIWPSSVRVHACMELRSGAVFPPQFPAVQHCGSGCTKTGVSAGPPEAGE